MWITLHDMMGLIQSAEVSDSQRLTPSSHKTQGILPAGAFRLELCLLPEVYHADFGLTKLYKFVGQFLNQSLLPLDQRQTYGILLYMIGWYYRNAKRLI